MRIAAPQLPEARSRVARWAFRLSALGLIAWGILAFGGLVLYGLAVAAAFARALGSNKFNPPGADDYVYAAAYFAGPILAVTATWMVALALRRARAAWGLWVIAAVLAGSAVASVASELPAVVHAGVWYSLFWLSTATAPSGAWMLSELRRPQP